MENENPTELSLREPHSLAIRIWHWLSYFSISGLLMTVLASSYLFGTKKNIAFVLNQAKESGVTMNSTQAKDLAHAYNDKIWYWHGNIGIVLSILFLFRIVVEIFLSKEEKFIGRLKKGLKSWNHQGIGHGTKHYVRVKFIYLVFYAILLVVVSTGLMLYFADDNKLLHQMEHNIKQVHNFCMYLVLGFIVVHLGGLIIAENTNLQGVVSDMINGGKKKN